MNKEIILNNIIGLNPTGTMNFEGTYKLNGTNNVVQNSSNASKENLKKAENNEIICSSVEHFENKIDTGKKKYFFIFFILIILFILFIKYFI